MKLKSWLSEIFSFIGWISKKKKNEAYFLFFFWEFLSKFFTVFFYLKLFMWLKDKNYCFRDKLLEKFRLYGVIGIFKILKGKRL